MLHVHSVTPVVIISISAQMSDALGRAICTTIKPSTHSLLVLPAAAYRRLTDFLACERVFCNHVVPKFLAYGWVILDVAAEPAQGKRPRQDDP